ncbi:Disintegrin and metalloproteinase domain-containing protein 12 [Myotis brandtii]|uniref:Disintegrin and metalloproteinase domain-containing protein 12 n=1 Tax=Myotis brandtii TaxID=109478 RepID=S7Q9X4_MYOBR|nr:Disintegrin and metalloproteinase domain-containing protein 12 [Myotis brandtii]
MWRLQRDSGSLGIFTSKESFQGPLNIRIVLVGVEVWNDIDKCPIGQDPFTSLHEFLDWRKAKLLPRKAHDNAQLVRKAFLLSPSGVYFQGTTIGMAPIMSMCTAEQSGGIVMDHSDSPLGAAVTLAHELGHNFGMNHDTLERGCSCRTAPDKGGCIMNPSTGQECTSRCCNASTCTLTPGAVCAHGLCCEHCQDVLTVRPGCPDTDWTRSPPPLTTPFENGLVRIRGAKPAPGICFERVNSAGDPYGNCGKDAKSSFAKCETRDAKCGKIQCQGGASRPVIGTNAVSIETNIPLQEGGRVLCRGTHVYLGDDMPDPGLVLAGTKCADGKVCNNRKNCHCEAHWAPPFCDKVGFGGSTDSGPIRQAGHRGLTAGVLASILCLLAAGLAVYLKRKTLVRLLFTDKKTLEKLRKEVGLPGEQTVGFSHDNPKRPPQCQNIAISRPLQALDRRQTPAGHPCAQAGPGTPPAATLTGAQALRLGRV